MVTLRPQRFSYLGRNKRYRDVLLSTKKGRVDSKQKGMKENNIVCEKWYVEMRI